MWLAAIIVVSKSSQGQCGLQERAGCQGVSGRGATRDRLRDGIGQRAVGQHEPCGVRQACLGALALLS